MAACIMTMECSAHYNILTTPFTAVNGVFMLVTLIIIGIVPACDSNNNINNILLSNYRELHFVIYSIKWLHVSYIIVLL